MKYKDVQRIGQGGFGIVDEVINDKNESFARKTFHISQPHLLDSATKEAVKKRFIREAKTQKALVHKNIVAVVDGDLNADPPYYIMPKAIASLADDIEEDNTLGGNFMSALMDILSGLEELHKLGITHRDLKPINVLRFKDDKGVDFYAIGDFGLMSVAHSTSISAITKTGMRMQSDMYAAPEIVAELKHASVQSDIYSVGCILHDFVGLAKRIPCHEIRERNNSFSVILSACTKKDVDRRFKSVGALRDALLSIGTIKIPAKTEGGAVIFKLFSKDVDKLKPEEWESLVNFVEDQFPNEDSSAVLSNLDIQHIDVLTSKHKPLAERIGIFYADWIRTETFQFNECDGLSTRLERFAVNCDIEVKAKCLMAMLYMGTRHNRWYVEKKFVGHLGSGLDTNLAQRLALEIRIDEDEACIAYKHLQRSINFDLKRLHPIIWEAFSQVCKK